MTFTHLLYDVDDGVATITLDRPEKLNAVDGTTIRELIDAFDRADRDDDVRAVIVTGAGRAFCAGADLSSGGATFDYRERLTRRLAAPAPKAPHRRSPPTAVARGRTPKPEEHRDGGGQVTLRIFEMLKPVIAAINGAAVGFGITMTLPMDFRIASTAARIGFVFTRRGVVPEAASTWFLPRLVGPNQAAEWMLTGRVFDAEEARAGGLVSRIVAPDALLPTARELAREIADNTSAISVALTRQMLWRLLGADHPREGHRLDSLGMFYTGRSPDAYEGVRAFLEKRPPHFPGKPSEDMPAFFPWR